MATPSLLSGPKPPTKFSANSSDCLHHLNESVH
jgi:hypothetical protein